MAAQRKGMFPWKGVTVFLLACSFTGAAGDVPDGVVYTDLHKTVLKGNTTILKCEFFGDPIAIYWKKGDDPDQGTKLISWVEGSNPSGSCVTDNACDMGGDYSLIIRDARISDQGRYICQVSNYLGILIHNYTDVKIYAPPTKPFPVIDECVESGSSTFNSGQPCSVLSNGSIVISCTVLNYYPDLDLFFLHGSQKITDAEINKATNVDGTKNKAISIKVSSSETPYVCVASDIPGSNDQRATTIFVKSLRPTESTITIPHGSHTSSTTHGGKMDTPDDNKAAKIVVPIVVIMVIVGIGIVLILTIRRWKRQQATRKHTQLGSDSVNNDTEEQLTLLGKAKIDGRDSATIIDIEGHVKANIDGEISFYELWSLAYETRENEKTRIHQVLTKLNIKDVKEGLTPGNIYDLLCKWKEETKTDDLAELLREALASVDLKSRWMQLCEQRQRADSKLSQETLQQIILEIGSPEKIQQFLGELIPNRPVRMDVKGEGKDIIEEAIEVMRKWSKGPFEENPFASLSLALERSGCSPLDRIFFDGMISFFEMWALCCSMEDDDVLKVRLIFEDLDLDIEGKLTGEELYESFCHWKDINKMISQGKLLRDALEKANFKGAITSIHDIRSRNNIPVSLETLEHILWHIKDPKKIDQLLKRLTLDDPQSHLDVSKGLKYIVQEALSRLKNWREQTFNENPLVLLSLALEVTGCSPVDRSFFKVPPELMLVIDEFKIGLFVDRLTSRHISKLTKCLNISKTENVMNKENKDALFNTESMISDWVAREECSNFEKRWKLNKAVDFIGRQNLEDFFGKPKPVMHIGVSYEASTAHTKGKEANFQRSDIVDDTFQRIATYLSPSQLKDLFGDSDHPRSSIQFFAEQQKGNKPKKDWREKLRKKLRSFGFRDLIREHSVYLLDLLDVAFRLLLEDVYPLAKALGISDEKLKDYRVDYAPNHLTKGTTAALIEFSEATYDDRSKVCQALSVAGYTDIAQLLEYGHETSLADEIAIASRAQDKTQALVKISQNLRMSNNRNTDTVLRDWRTTVHHPLYNHRTSLADAVCPVLGAEVARGIFSGEYRTRSSVSPAVMQAIIRGIQSFKQPLISKILGADDAKKLPDQRVVAQAKSTSLQDKKRTDVNKDLPLDDFTKSRSPDTKGETCGMDRTDESTTTQRLAQILGVKVAQPSSTQEISIKQVLETWEKKTSLGKDDRRKLSDDLLRAGFKEFAFEVMIGSVPSKKSKLPWKRGKQLKVGKQYKSAESDDSEEEDSDADDKHDSDDNGERDNKDDVEPVVNDSVGRSINGVQASTETGDPSIEDIGNLVLKAKSNDPSHAGISVQANVDPPSETKMKEATQTTSSSDSDIKDRGNQTLSDSGEPAINVSSEPPSETKMKEATQTKSSSDVQATTSTESGDTDVKDSSNETPNGGDT